MNNFIKIILAIILFLCLADMPYGYYQLVRFVSCFAFTYLAYIASQNQAQTLVILYLGLALLFQPFIKISLGRELWNIVDIIVGLFLIGSLLLKNDKKS